MYPDVDASICQVKTLHKFINLHGLHKSYNFFSVRFIVTIQRFDLNVNLDRLNIGLG